MFPARKAICHKGNFGRVLIIGGSTGMSGAVTLAGLAALHTGSGLVRLAVPKSILDVVAGFAPEYMTLPLPDDSHGRIKFHNWNNLLNHAANADVVAIGPGMGRSIEVDALIRKLNTFITKPLILDADALNALASLGTENVLRQLAQAAGPRILTPHPGEFFRLTGIKVSDSENDRKKQALQFAQNTKTVLVLKGHHTIVADERNTYLNSTGNPGMAVGGSGDVLTGIIASLTGQGLDLFEASKTGVFLHGMAGDLAFPHPEEVSHSVLPTELISNLHKAILKIKSLAH